MMKSTLNLLQSIAITLLVPTIALGQPVSTETPAAPSNSTPSDSAPMEDVAPVLLKQEELDQLIAPIALYPDSVLSQMFMAATYPLEIVQADRWAKANPQLKDKALATELEKQDWDPSVRSLVNFPQVLSMMSEKLDLTIKLGDAFLAQQADVMNTVQNLRAKAQATGNLQSNEQQKVTATAAPTTQDVVVNTGTTSSPTQIITIESSEPDVIYVPTYDSTVVYGGWPYPSYPPYPYYPPGYYGGAALSFGIGVACGVAWGYAWGNCNWNGGDIDIDVDHNYEFNGDIDRDQFKSEMENRQGERQGRQDERQTGRDDRQGDRGGEGRTGEGRSGKSSFQHDPSHRKGVAYKDNAMSQKYQGSTRSERDAMSREQYRGRAEQGRQDINRQGPDRVNQDIQRSDRSTADRSANQSGNRSSDRSAGSSDRSRSSASSRDSGKSSGAFSDVDRGGSSARSSSNRGSSSRASSSGSRGGGSRSSGGRGGGGRGGGGRR